MIKALRASKIISDVYLYDECAEREKVIIIKRAPTAKNTAFHRQDHHTKYQ